MGKWLMTIDNSDNEEVLFGTKGDCNGGKRLPAPVRERSHLIHNPLLRDSGIVSRQGNVVGRYGHSKTTERFRNASSCCE